MLRLPAVRCAVPCTHRGPFGMDAGAGGAGDRRAPFERL